MGKSWQELLGEALKKAAKDMGSALAAYYPQDDDDRQPEAYITNYLARALGPKVHIYPEFRVGKHKGARGRLDMIVLFKEANALVGIECKDLSHRYQDFESFKTDIGKLLKFEDPVKLKDVNLRITTIGRALVASTWFGDIVKPWQERASHVGSSKGWRGYQEAFLKEMREKRFNRNKAICVGRWLSNHEFKAGTTTKFTAKDAEKDALLWILSATRSKVLPKRGRRRPKA